MAKRNKNVPAKLNTGAVVEIDLDDVKNSKFFSSFKIDRLGDKELTWDDALQVISCSLMEQANRAAEFWVESAGVEVDKNKFVYDILKNAFLVSTDEMVLNGENDDEDN